MQDDGLYAALLRRGMTRRSFLGFSAAMAAALALPATFAPQIAKALEGAKRLPVIWVRGQSCGGDTEALLRSGDPTAVSLFLDVLAVEYHDSLLAVAGADAELARTSAMQLYPNGYIAVVEGSIPDGASGAYCLIAGRPAADVVREVSAGALATIAVGSCACDGGAAAAGWNTTHAGGVKGLVGNGKYMALPGCPVNPVNLASVLVHWIANSALPPADLAGRPLSAYGNLIHNQCERRPHFEFGEFATEWGDQGAQEGWCLYKLGCKGPETMGNCPTVKYGEKISWNVRAGHGCIGCMTPSFWNEMGPAYKRLPSPLFFLPNVTTDMLGGGLLAGIGGVAGVHAVGMGVRFKRRRMIAAREKAKLAVAPGVTGPLALAAELPEADAAETQAAPPANETESAQSESPVTRAAGPVTIDVAPNEALDAAEREAGAEAALDAGTLAGPEER
ncbi:MAG TPA: hydrogenase small subunit [Candidatus Limnocylindrales bacterium]